MTCLNTKNTYFPILYLYTSGKLYVYKYKIGKDEFPLDGIYEFTYQI